MTVARWIRISAFWGLVSLFASSAQGMAVQYSDSSRTADGREEQIYSAATRAINESRWSDAELLLDRVFDQHRRRADAALYWKAYVENKEGRKSDALGTCSKLNQMYPQSSWLEECNVLEIEIHGKVGAPVQPESVQNEDLKLLALNSLIQSGSPNALPDLQQMLESGNSERLKDRALFVLAEDRSERAREILRQIALGEKDPELQIGAIRMYALLRGPDSAKTLASIYRMSNDPSVKRTVLHSFLVMNELDPLMRIAENEANLDLRRQAIRELGALGAVSGLTEIYRATNIREIKSASLNALVLAGSKGVEALSAVASTETDADLRHKAIRNIGECGNPATIPLLLSLYSKAPDADTKTSIIGALFVSRDFHDLVALGREEKDFAIRKEIISKLALAHTKEAENYLQTLLK